MALQQVGEVLLDSHTTTASACTIGLTEGQLLDRGIYLELKPSETESFVARIVDGPYFFSPTLEGKRNLPVYRVELLSRKLNGQDLAVLARPPPGTPAFRLQASDIQNFIGTGGDMKVGRLSTQKDVIIGLDSATLIRHFGIFGTTGSGKSNSLQVIVEEAVKTGFSVLLLDIEGEYVATNQPTDKLINVLAEYNEKPRGIPDLQVVVPKPFVSRSPTAKSFSLPFHQMDKEIFCEIAGFSQMEKIYFFTMLRRATEYAADPKNVRLSDVVDRLKRKIEAQADKTDLPEAILEAHMSLFSKLTFVQRLGLLDSGAPAVSVEDMLISRRLTVIDVNEATDAVRNMVVAHFLDIIFRHKMKHPDTPKMMILLEEAHTLVSKDKAEKMVATMTLLLELARRGRKRGISLGFVTQQPSHLPSEFIELCNTRIIHKLGSTTNIDILRKSTGQVPDQLWDILPSLGRGETLISSPKYNQAVIAQVRPAASRRLATE